ncbi:MAG: hypothetical protein CVU34_10150 [Betaproteobacteria bacterium HGW-Betaproteobacteria-7]|jgi:hypothetical protein|nr:MAG: hypothetical protein CVU34_10150 [Betaproteobacteria bacterium HGW-Betaproteobacteria-7]
MQTIKASIAPGAQNTDVVNLQAALRWLHAHGAFKTYDPPNAPTAEALKALIEKLADEEARQSFGEATRQMVIYFQIQQALGDHLGGVIEETTATRLNAVLAEFGAFAGEGYRVSGKVRDRLTMTPRAGVRVLAYDQDVGRASLLGETTTDAEGRYLVAFPEKAFRQTAAERGGPELFVRALDQAGRVLGQSARVNSAGMATELDVELGSWLVRGQVTDPSGQGAGGLRVLAFDRDLRAEHLLGEATTDRNGHYLIAYVPAGFEDAESMPAAPDLVVRVHEAGDDGVLLAESALLFNAQALEVVDLVVPQRGTSEFEQLGVAIAPLLRGQGALRLEHHVVAPAERGDLLPRELGTDDARFIARETGLGIEAVQLWAESAEQQHEALQLLEAAGQSAAWNIFNSHGWAFLFGWRKAGFAGGLKALLNAGPDQWRASMRLAEMRKWVAPWPPEESQSLLGALALLGASGRFDPRFAATPLLATMGRFPSGLPDDVAIRTLSLFEEKGVDGLAEFAAIADSEPALAPGLVRMERTLRVFDLVGGNAPLMEPLMQRLDAQGATLEPLAMMSGGDWMEMVQGAGLEGDAGRDQAALLQLRVEQMHPTVALEARIKGQELAFEGHDPGTLGLLIDSNRAAVDFLLAGGDLDLAGGFAKEYGGLAEQIRDLGRWVKAGAGFVAGAEFIREGFKSPGQITNFGSRVLDDILGTLPAVIRDLIVGMREKFKRDLGSYLNIQPDILVPDKRRYPPDEPPQPQIEPVTTAPGVTGASIRGMFGDIDDCICLPCESILGQSAYLVDLLTLLRREVVRRPASGNLSMTGIDILRARRPDILDLELSCANSETLLPHIDLALERLEWQAVSGSLGYGHGSSRPIAQWFTPNVDSNLQALLARTCSEPIGPLQAMPEPGNARLWRITDGLRIWRMLAVETQGMPAGEARAFQLLGFSLRRTLEEPDPRFEPAHRIPEAYALLAGAAYPWSLPFDRQHEESRAYLSRLNLSRRKLLALLPSTSSALLDGETLDLTPGERGLVESARTGDALWQAWGFANAGMITVTDPVSAEMLVGQGPQALLQRASFLMARSGLGLAELEAVLATRFVGRYRLTERHQCKTSLMRAAPRLADDALDRLCRFVRLWRKRPGWTAELLDSALEAMNAIPAPAARLLDQAVIAQLAASEQTSTALGVPPEFVLGLQAPLSAVNLRTDPDGRLVTLFEHVFLSSRVGAADRAAFARVAAPGNIVAEPIADHADAIGAALGVSASTVAAILASMPLSLGDRLSHDGLTWLYRRLSLARELGVSAADLAGLIALTGENPIAADLPPPTASMSDRLAGFARLASFARLATALLESGLDIALATDALLPAGHAARPTGVTPDGIRSDGQIENDLKALRARLASVLPATTMTHEALRQYLVESLSAIMAEATARQVVAAFAEPVAVAEAHLVAALSTADGDPFGTSLMTPGDATALLVTQPAVSEDERLRRTLNALAARTRRQVLVDVVGAWTSTDGDTLTSLLSGTLTIDPETPGGARRLPLSVFAAPAFWSVAASAPLEAAVVLWVRRLDRLLALLKTPGPSLGLACLPGRDWAALILPTGAPGGTSVWQSLSPILDLRLIADPTHIASDTLRAHLAALADASLPLQLALKPLAERFKLSPAALLELSAHAFGSAADRTALRNPALLRKLADWAALSRALGASADQLAVLAGTDLAAMLGVARQLLAVRVGAANWPKTLQGIADGLRIRQRDALVACLVAREGWQHGDALYEQLLLDPQVQPCFMTSRVTQAVAAVQLLVQRILFGLEPEAMASDTLRQRWSWMRSYRLWEANRKIFLYPENWLFPELRDDKSPAFRQLESRLSQGELSMERAGQAFGQFLDDISRGAQTQVISAFEDVDTPPNAAGQRPSRRDLYLVGRSPNPPYLYYWRRCQDFGKRWMEWTPWERVELDIQSDHVTAFVAQGRLHLAWPVIQEQASPGSPVADKWKTELAWSQFDGSSWRQVSTSRGNAPVVDRVPFEDVRSAFAFRAYVPASGYHPTIYAYLKAKASGTTVVVEKAPGEVSEDLSAPAHLYEVAGIPELARLMAATFGQLPIDTRGLVEFYLVKTNINDVGYNLLSIRDLLLERRHLEWHRSVRNLNHIRTLWESFTYDAASLSAFLTDFRIHGYNGGSVHASGSWTLCPYVQLMTDIMAKCSGLQLSYRVWVQLGTSATDLRALSAADGQFQLAYPHQSTPVSLRPAPDSLLILNGGQTNAAEALVSWTPAGRQALPADLLPVSGADVGKLVRQTLHFVIKDLTNASGFRSQVPPSRPYRQLQRFVIHPSGVMDSDAGDGSLLEALDGNSDVWMGGLREVSTDLAGQALSPAFPLNLPRVWQTPLAVFTQSNSVDRYEIVSAAASGNTALNHAGIWHFAEGKATCFIDTNAESASSGSGAKIGLYPNAWLKGDLLSQSWYGEGRLPSWSGQSDDFGSAALPILASGVSGIRSALPDAVKNGGWTFDNRLPNALYWWEICFHAPMLVADQLSKQHRFEEAERWFRMVFDPSGVEPGLPQSFLRFRVFRGLPRGLSAGRDLKTLAKAIADGTANPFVDSMQSLIARWRSQPYRPFVIARQRHVAFLWRTVFSYLDNLLAWADNLYRRDTREAVAEATQLYVLAARILGPRPRQSPAKRDRAASSYLDLEQKWDDFANAWFDASGPASSASTGASSTMLSDPLAPEPMGYLFFCIPINDKLISYWNIVQGRLFNVRHCRNIDGVARQLPLTDAPIDPELLARATAAGLDMESIISGLYAPPSHYRYAQLVARALDLANDVRAYGAAVLSALEKRDAETLALLRQTNEIELLNRVVEVRQLQVSEAEHNLAALRISRATVAARFEQIQRQMGKTEKVAPGEQEYVGEDSPLGRLAGGNALSSSNWGLIVEEQRQLDEQKHASVWTDADSIARLMSSGFNILASAANITSMSDPTKTSESLAKAFTSLGSASGSVADSFRAIAQLHQTEASRQAAAASHIRRRDEWAYQGNQALRELRQIDRQILANEIRVALSKLEMQNHALQIEHAESIDDYLRTKFTNADLYEWMSSELANLQRVAYRMALDAARKAERAAVRELGVRRLDIIRSDHWGSRRASLLAGEQLLLDVKRLEIAYMERNRREFELTKHISLSRLDPVALMQLISAGICEVRLPEWLFDQDAPGHYQRRIKSLSLSIPCVVGPYTSVNLKATLIRSEIRIDASATDASDYPRQETMDDPRFELLYSASESICTSSGRDDAGLFEPSSRDERYLPFEHAGAISTWQLEWPGTVPAFDYASVRDVIFHIRYTARDGGSQLRQAALDHLSLATGSPVQPGLLIDLRREFAQEWGRAVDSGAQGTSITVSIGDAFFPYAFIGRSRSIMSIHLWTRVKGEGEWREFQLANVANGADWRLDLDLRQAANDLDEAIVAVGYSVG